MRRQSTRLISCYRRAFQLWNYQIWLL